MAFLLTCCYLLSLAGLTAATQPSRGKENCTIVVTEPGQNCTLQLTCPFGGNIHFTVDIQASGKTIIDCAAGNSCRKRRDGHILTLTAEPTPTATTLNFTTDAVCRDETYVCQAIGEESDSQSMCSLKVSESNASGDVNQNPGPGPRAITDSAASTMDLQKMLTSMFEQQHGNFLAGFESLKSQLSLVQDTLNELRRGATELRSNLTHIQKKFSKVTAEYSETMQEYMEAVNKNLDKLESFWRRNSLLFYGISEHGKENVSKCARRVVNLLQKVVPWKSWKASDIVRAHRLRPARNDRSDRGTNPRPMLVEFTRWTDKRDLLTKGRRRLRQEGVIVSDNLTTRQGQTLKGYRNQGRRAYDLGNRLMLDGLVKHRDNPSTSASRAAQTKNAAQRSVDSASNSPHPEGNPSASRPPVTSTSETPSRRQSLPRAEQVRSPSPSQSSARSLTDPAGDVTPVKLPSPAKSQSLVHK